MQRRVLAAPLAAAVASLQGREHWRSRPTRAPDHAPRPGALGCQPQGRLGPLKQLGPPRTSDPPSYDVVHDLGKGNFGQILRVRKRDSGEHRAIKRVGKSSTEVHTLLQEIDIMRQLPKHRNVAEFTEGFVDDRHACLVREWCNGVDLFQWIESRQGKAVDEAEIAQVFEGMVSAVQHCHDQGVLHLDVKPENFILVPDRVVKLIDFGFAESMGELSDQVRGTEGYLPPEAYRSAKTPAFDTWALGVTLFIMLTGGFMPSFTMDHDLDQASRAALRRCSREARELCTGLLAPKPEERMPLRSASRHPFLQSDDTALKATYAAVQRLLDRAPLLARTSKC